MEYHSIYSQEAAWLSDETGNYRIPFFFRFCLQGEECLSAQIRDYRRESVRSTLDYLTYLIMSMRENNKIHKSLSKIVEGGQGHEVTLH